MAVSVPIPFGPMVVILRTSSSFDPENCTRRSKDVTQSGDLLGAVARLPREHPLGRLTQDTVKLVPRGVDVPLDYLYWLLRTPQYRGYCRSHATGTTNLGLPREDFPRVPRPRSESDAASHR